MTASRRSRSWPRPLGALALALGLCAGAARADHLDDQLNKHGELIVADKAAMKELQDAVINGEEFKRNSWPVGSATISIRPKAATTTGGN